MAASAVNAFQYAAQQMLASPRMLAAGTAAGGVHERDMPIVTQLLASLGHAVVQYVGDVVVVSPGHGFDAGQVFSPPSHPGNVTDPAAGFIPSAHCDGGAGDGGAGDGGQRGSALYQPYAARMSSPVAWGDPATAPGPAAHHIAACEGPLHSSSELVFDLSDSFDKQERGIAFALPRALTVHA